MAARVQVEWGIIPSLSRKGPWKQNCHTWNLTKFDPLQLYIFWKILNYLKNNT